MQGIARLQMKEAALDQAGIGIASAMSEIVGLPTLHVVREGEKKPGA